MVYTGPEQRVNTSDDGLPQGGTSPCAYPMRGGTSTDAGRPEPAAVGAA